jgi:CO/xanthine dehydrogenase Mo-binding subunit
VGKPLVRTDVPGKANGRTRYAGDYTMPNMLHAKVLRSPLASARLKRIDVSKAKALPGVACLLTAADLPDRLAPTDIPGQTGKKRLATDQQILVRERVRYHGEPLALIAAETEAIAEKAMDLIDYELEPLPGVFDPLEAMQPGAPVVQGANNIVSEYKVRKGDIERGFAEADRIIENTYRTTFQEHAFLEPEVGLAWVDENEVINIRVSTQVIEHFRFIADAVGLPHNRVRILGALVGGGFGGKEDVTVEIYLALLARATARPVRLVYTREDSFFGHGKRHPFVITHRARWRRPAPTVSTTCISTPKRSPPTTCSPAHFAASVRSRPVSPTSSRWTRWRRRLPSTVWSSGAGTFWPRATSSPRALRSKARSGPTSA